jgi:hypothetical protein
MNSRSRQSLGLTAAVLAVAGMAPQASAPRLGGWQKGSTKTPEQRDKAKRRRKIAHASKRRNRSNR